MISPDLVVRVRILFFIFHFAQSIFIAPSRVIPSPSQYIMVEASHGDCMVSPLSVYPPNIVLQIFACILLYVKLRVAGD